MATISRFPCLLAISVACGLRCLRLDGIGAIGGSPHVRRNSRSHWQARHSLFPLPRMVFRESGWPRLHIGYGMPVMRTR